MVRKKPALTPALSPEERETVFPRIGNVGALDWHRFRGAMREGFGEISPHFAPPAAQNAEREKRSLLFAMAEAFRLKDSGKMHAPSPGIHLRIIKTSLMETR